MIRINPQASLSPSVPKLRKSSNSVGQIDHLRVFVAGETGSALDRVVDIVATSRCHTPSAAEIGTKQHDSTGVLLDWHRVSNLTTGKALSIV
jgi:hypothetical protein